MRLKEKYRASDYEPSNNQSVLRSRLEGKGMGPAQATVVSSSILQRQTQRREAMDRLKAGCKAWIPVVAQLGHGVPQALMAGAREGTLWIAPKALMAVQQSAKADLGRPVTMATPGMVQKHWDQYQGHPHIIVDHCQGPKFLQALERIITPQTTVVWMVPVR